MNERQFRYLICIARVRNTQKASVILGKNPSTLTRMMRKVEEELGVRIFRRQTGGLVLTPEGEQLVLYGEKIMKQFGEMEEYRRSMTEGNGTRRFWTENEVRYLRVIREQKKISAAAEELFLAQPSLSQMLRSVEVELGLPLFERSAGGVSETEFGKGILDRLECIYDEWTGLHRELEKFQKMKKGTVRLGIPMNLGTYLLPVILPLFMERYPGIQVLVRESNTTELERVLLAKKIDFCIMHDLGNQKTLKYEASFQDPFVLVMPERMRETFDFPENRKLDAHDIRKLRDTPFIMVARRQRLRDVADRILEKAHLQPFIRCTTHSMETAKRLVAAGMGVTFLPKPYLELYSGTEGLVSYPLADELEGTWQIVIACPKTKELSESAQELLKFSKEYLMRLA